MILRFNEESGAMYDDFKLQFKSIVIAQMLCILNLYVLSIDETKYIYFFSKHTIAVTLYKMRPYTYFFSKHTIAVTLYKIRPYTYFFSKHTIAVTLYKMRTYTYFFSKHTIAVTLYKMNGFLYSDE